MGFRAGTATQAAAATQSAPATQAGAQQVQQSVANNSIGPEERRKLSTVSAPPSGNGGQTSLDIPRDTTIKRMNLELVAAFTVTYASGSPVLSPLGLLARIATQCTINADGSRNIKIVDLYMQRCMNAVMYGGFPRRAYQTGAGLTTTTTEPTTEWLAGSVAYPATTQDIIVNESVDLCFENYFAYEQGRRTSLLYTKNLSTCTLGFNFAAMTNIIQDGNAAPVTYSNISIQIIPTIIENREADISSNSFDFVETFIQKQFTSQTSQFSIDLNTGNRLLGLGLLVRNGDTSKTLSDTAMTDMNLLLNGSTSIFTSNFRQLQNDNKGRFATSEDQFLSGSHSMQGFAFLNLMKNGSIYSGIDTRYQSGVSQLQLQVSTAASTGIDPATYTNPVTVGLMQQQFIPVPVKQ